MKLHKLRWVIDSHATVIGSTSPLLDQVGKITSFGRGYPPPIVGYGDFIAYSSSSKHEDFFELTVSDGASALTGKIAATLSMVGNTKDVEGYSYARGHSLDYKRFNGTTTMPQLNLGILDEHPGVKRYIAEARELAAIVTPAGGKIITALEIVVYVVADDNVNFRVKFNDYSNNKFDFSVVKGPQLKDVLRDYGKFSTSSIPVVEVDAGWSDFITGVNMASRLMEATV